MIRTLLTRANAAAAAFDNWSYSPAEIGDKLADLRFAQAKKQAMADSDFAAEEKLRSRNSGTYIANSEEDHLTLDGMFAHLDRMRELAPHTWVDDVIYAVKEARLRRITGTALRAFDRLTRGWDESELWNLDTHMARRIGTQLIALADEAHGWPAGSYETFEDWSTALREHGDALLAYGTARGSDELLTLWHGLPAGEAKAEAFEAMNAHDAMLAEGASRAWVWIAENHQSLWD